jgi:hypothetical protein
LANENTLDQVAYMNTTRKMLILPYFGPRIARGLIGCKTLIDAVKHLVSWILMCMNEGVAHRASGAPIVNFYFRISPIGFEYPVVF